MEEEVREKKRLRWSYKYGLWAGGRHYGFCKRCARCGEDALFGRNAILCEECRRARSVAFERERTAATVAVARARRHGELCPPSDFECVDCGNKAQVYDHRDYSKPLDVVPVCLKCNSRRGPGRRIAFESDPDFGRFPSTRKYRFAEKLS